MLSPSSSTFIYSALKNSQTPIDWQQLLPAIISAFDCSTGTIHVLDKKTNLLMLQAHQGIPPFLLPKMSAIPIGKGMAGIAAERREPVEMCNLQTDESGVARPAAKETRVEGSIAVPLLLEGELYGVLGIAKPVPYDFTEEETKDLMQIGEEMSRRIRATYA
ncbi:GAF domain-containing protein [Pontibacter ummariensis]|uniref:GAF domain-containing protein n=1 Tax=Pontibacter ummariensis TaxID=1610492 RepID=A0A239I4J3_9BACT|nr:GAF domain-containing protein [Pontibacter ummariensis]PRY10201.1 GAF domain-containing protein [Pontibacter ummariensis]SNS87993.1 GAF domain-containing protein [Pontibacter ummariensis]